MSQPANKPDAASSSRLWKAIPLFISSTFRDMHAERDELNNVVFPAIAERLKSRRCRLEPIDLRVGVETDRTQTERERELKILKVCLAEIERSRPFLLVLLGDRYGWVPGSDRIEAASSEAGFTPEDKSVSVTALEIEYGLMKKSVEQRRRSLLCLREPLPCDRMPNDKAAIYSDAYATDPGAPDRVQHLKKLKAKIFTDGELAAHRLPYSLDWDEALQRPKAESTNGVKVWGQKVEAALWALLDDETRAFASQKELTWQEEEQFAIEELVERLNGSFVGRKSIVKQSFDLATSPAATSAGLGLCLVGATGSGKSALFARLQHELSQRQDILLLAHAAGISPRAGQTEWMLRRWIGELGATLGEPPDLPEKLKPEELEKLFAQLLHRVATTRRVVVLVDALNQFIRTDRARTVSWLPMNWPANARFICTAIPGEETQNLAHRNGLSLVSVPPLDAGEEDAIAAQVYGRYHRQPNAEVLHVVTALRLPDGAVAAGNPLWLTLALDLLNQLDADDFSEAEAGVGSAEEKLRRMVLARAKALTPNVEGLYGQLLTRVEKVAGAAETHAFAALIALSRNGWRQDDLQHLLPKAAELLSTLKNRQTGIGNHKFSWDALRFATLRRCFRAHLVRRGKFAQWDFAHATLRQAIVGRITKSQGLAQSIHRVILYHLVSLPWTDTPGMVSDPLRESELMAHLIYAGDAEHAAKLLAEIAGPYSLRTSVGYAATVPSIQALVDYIAQGEVLGSKSHLNWVISLLSQPGLSDEQVQMIASRFDADLDPALEAASNLSTRRTLAEAVLQTRQHFAKTIPSDRNCIVALCNSLNKISKLARSSGDFASAIRYAEESNQIGKQLATTKSDTGIKEQSFSDDATMSVLGNPSISGSSPLAAPAVDLDNPVSVNEYKQWLGHELSALREQKQENQEEIRQVEADINTRKLGDQDAQCTALDSLGRIALAEGDLAAAQRHFTESFTIREKIAASDRFYDRWLHAVANPQETVSSELEMPSRTPWQNNLAVSLSNLGELALKQGDLIEASKYFGRACAIIRRMVAGDSSNMFRQKATYQTNLAIIFNRLGDVAKTRGDMEAALGHYQEAIDLWMEALRLDPGNPEIQLGLANSKSYIGDISKAKGNFKEARNYYDESANSIQQIVATDPTNHDWQQALCHAFEKLANLATSEENHAEALRLNKLMQETCIKLDNLFPSSSVYKRALALLHFKCAVLAENMNDQSAFWRELECCDLAFQEMKQCGILHSTDKEVLDYVRQILTSRVDPDFSSIRANPKTNTVENPTSTIAAMPAPSAQERSTIQDIQSLLDAGQLDAALRLAENHRTLGSFAKNAHAVCLMRLGRAREAVEILRGMVFRGSGEHLSRYDPVVFQMNLATAMLAAGDVHDCLKMLSLLNAEEAPHVRRLRAAIKSWEAGLSIWERWRHRRSKKLNKPIKIDPPIGEL